MSDRSRRGLARTPCLLAAALAAALLAWGRVPFPAVKREWSIAVYSGPSPFALSPDPAFALPVLTRRAVTDARARFVADPFLLRREGRQHLFFEVLDEATRKGAIGLAASGDDRSFRYEGIVLDEPFHLSYPFVFEEEGRVYMVPESHEARQVRLYVADPFPRRWRLVRTLVSGTPLSDPTLVRHGGKLWLFAGHLGDRALDLYVADRLDAPFRPHPGNPVVRDDPHGARPAGRPFVFEGRLFRPGQDDSPRYGRAVRAYEVLELTPERYREAPQPRLLAGPSGRGWNARGMHTVDAAEVAPGRWVAAVDGQRPGLFLDFLRLR